jgi:magnesium transporter
MLMLSTLRRFELVDGRGRRARLDDFAVTLRAGAHPRVTRLVFPDAEGRSMTLPWEYVVEIDPRRRRFLIDNFEASQSADAAPAGEVLLRRDVLDALILDLEGRRVMRANDLCLKEYDGKLLLWAADVSWRAILRRLSRGVFGAGPGAALYDWKYIEFLRGHPEAVRKGAGYHKRIARLPPGEIARLSEAVPYLHAVELLALLPDKIAVEVLEVMSPERQLQVFEELGEDEAAALLALLAPDVAADLAARLHGEAMPRVLERLPQRKRERVVDLLRYPEQSVGGLMTNDVVFAPQDWTVAEARVRLREQIKGPDFVYFVYVVDDEKSQRLRGAVTLRDLFVADEGQRLKKVMNRLLDALDPLANAHNGAHRVIDSRLPALPVVAEDGRLLGEVTFDVAVSKIAPPSFGAQPLRVFS